MDSIDLHYLSNPETTGVNLLPEHSSHHFFVEGKEPLFSLNGDWDFYRSSGWTEELLDPAFLAYKKVKLPRSAEMEVPEELIYTNTEYPWEGKEDLKAGEINLLHDPVNLYRKRFRLPKNFKGERYLLRFEGFETAIYVYLNGHFVGYSTRLYVDSEFDITPYLEEENELLIYNFRWSASSWILDQDYWKMSGIFRDISLLALPALHLEDIDIKTDLIHGLKDGFLNLQGKTTGKGQAEIALCQGKKLFVHENVAIENGSFHLEKEIKRILPWSADKPNLYWLTITLFNEEGKESETSSLEIGFTHQEIKDGVLYFNGEKLLIKGVNRHEVDSLYGHHVPLESLQFDLSLMKKNNINAIRTCHYPNEKRFYELANRMGFYVMDECCIESHGQWINSNGDTSLWIPGSNPKWNKIALDRAQSMYERDKNNPCIFSWSLGNESAGGTNMIAEADYFHSVDKKRVVHYEPENYDPSLTDHLDMKSFMYAKPADLEKFLKTNPTRPTIECEYEHAMGNSCGNFDEYMKLFRSYPNAIGGFIWDFIDQGLYVKNPRGKGKAWVYGGDENDVPNDRNFNCNGILFSERKDASRSMKLAITKNVYSPVQVNFVENEILLSLDPGFLKPSDFNLVLIEMVNGEPKAKRKLIWKGENKLPLPSASFEGEWVRKVVVFQKGIGEIASFDNSDSVFSYEAEEPRKALKKAETLRYVGYHEEGFSMVFEKYGSEPGLLGINLEGRELLVRAPRLTFWRPATDNDRGNLFCVKSSLYLGASRWNYPVNTLYKDSTLTFTYLIGALGAKAELSYHFGEGRYVDIEIRYHGAKGMPSLPCFGIDFAFKKDLKKYRYYGRGPLDSYSDAKMGTTLGIFASTPEESLLPYSVPQECGNREETRYVALPFRGHELRFEALERPFSFHYLPYDEFQLDDAQHLDELPPSYENHLTIYGAMRGIGGDDSWGAPVHPQYELDGEKEYSLKFRLLVR